MMERSVTMTLLSDAIFGSGMSIPGGEDISVKLDETGAPYLSGSTFKGLLRESVENWLDWEARADRADVLEQLFGADGDWNGSPGTRRVFVSPLTLAPGQRLGDLLGQRTFTSIDPETGTVREGTLRVASCVRKGTVFQGQISFAAEDQALVESALLCIEYLGTSRTRGFGRVRFSVGEAVRRQSVPETTGSGDCLRYGVELLENVRVTDLDGSHNTFLEGKRWIPSSAVRGAVLSRLARQNQAWFEANKTVLLQEVCFTDLIPGNPGTKPAIPVPMGFYEGKLKNNFHSLLVEEDVRPGTKRAKLGSFCTLEEQGGKLWIRGWSPKLGADTRINLDMQNKGGDKPGGLFQTGHLLRGQKAEGMVLFSDGCGPELKNRIVEAFCEENGALRLGANIHAGFGLCQLTEAKWCPEAPEAAAYGFRTGDSVPETLYMMLLSPLMLLDEAGEPRGMDRAWLGAQLGGVKVNELLCATTVAQQSGFNRTFGTRLPIRTFYQPGSMFRIDCESAPSLDCLKQMERAGLGVCREEGWGRVLFLRNLPDIRGRFERTDEGETSKGQRKAASKRRVRAEWLLDEGRAKKLRGKLSKSQLGSVQELLTFAAAHPEPQKRINGTFEGWMTDSAGGINPAKRDLYTPVQNYINSVLEGADLPDSASEWSTQERLELLIDLIRVSRKEGKDNGKL